MTGLVSNAMQSQALINRLLIFLLFSSGKQSSSLDAALEEITFFPVLHICKSDKYYIGESCIRYRLRDESEIILPTIYVEQNGDDTNSASSVIGSEPEMGGRVWSNRISALAAARARAQMKN